ncbi:PIN domain-containing protein [Candidatus Desantisbacteria bacterium]|nr:PIN domain-containing protein [Candidatus Desantisbacteria bacterium]
MAEKYILDTHTLFWYLTASPKLSRKAKDIIEKVLTSGEKVVISVITLAELYYLNEKIGKPLDFFSEYKKLEENLEIAPIETTDILSFVNWMRLKKCMIV